MGTSNQSNVITGHHALCYPTEYVKAADLRGKDVTVVVDHAEWENLVMQGGKRDRKVALHLRAVNGKKLEKRLIVGKTNLRSIAATVGDPDVGKWSGQKITLYPTTCRGADGKQVECIRVRVRTSQSATDIPEDMAATPTPKTEFFDEAAGDDEEATREPIPMPRRDPEDSALNEALAIHRRTVAAKSESEINIIAADLETVKKRIRNDKLAELRALIAARREALAGVVDPSAEPPAGAP